MLQILASFICASGLALTTANDASLNDVQNVTLAFVGFRHGFRNPAQFIKDDPSRQKYGWGWEGESHLTKIGKQQAYGIGKFLRKRYKALLADDYSPSQIKGVTSSADRCQMTLQTALAGLTEPTSDRATILPNLRWQPVPYQINDQLLRTYNLKCPAYTKAYQAISDDTLSESSQWLKEKGDLARYIAKNTKFNASLSDLADVADNIQSMIKNKVPLPDWLDKPTLAGYDRKSALKETLRFGEAHQIQCARKADCARAMAGLWLWELTDRMASATKLPAPGPRFSLTLYAAHTETVLSLLRLVGADVAETPPSGGFVLELKAANPARLRLMTHEPADDDPTNQVRELKAAKLTALKEISGEPNWYKLEDFVNVAKPNAFSDWFEFCGFPKHCLKNSCSP